MAQKAVGGTKKKPAKKPNYYKPADVQDTARATLPLLDKLFGINRKMHSTGKKATPSAHAASAQARATRHRTAAPAAKPQPPVVVSSPTGTQIVAGMRRAAHRAAVASKPAKKTPKPISRTPVAPVRNTARPSIPNPGPAPVRGGGKGGAGKPKGGKAGGSARPPAKGGSTAPGTGGTKPGTPAKDPLLTQAEAAVSAELDPQIAELNRQRTENLTQGEADIARIKQLFGLAQADTETQRAAIEAAYKSGDTKLADLFSGLNTQTDETFNKNIADTNAENARLGINTGGDTKNIELARDNTKSLNSTEGGIFRAGLTEQGLSSDAMMRRLSASEGAQSAGLQTDRLGAMQELSRTLSSQSGILEASRKAKVTTLLAQLQTQKASTDAERQQQAFLNQIAARKLGISEQQLAANIQKSKAEIAIKQQANQIKLAGIELTRKKNETDAAYKARAQAIQEKNATTAQRRAAAEAQNAKIKADTARIDAQAKIDQLDQSYKGQVRHIKASNFDKITQNRIIGLLSKYNPKGYPQGTASDRLRADPVYNTLNTRAKRMLNSAWAQAYGS